MENDRISYLSDDLLRSILSFVDSKTAAQTTVLSKRWMGLWSQLSVINFGFKNVPNVFRDEDLQTNFINNFLARRDNIKVSRLTLSFQFKPPLGLAQSVISYAISHDVEELFVDLIIDDDDDVVYVLFSLYSCPTLKKLVLFSDFVENLETMYWELPNLHTLYLMLPRFDDHPPLPLEFLTCLPNLKTLGLRRWLLPSSLELPHLTSLKLYDVIHPDDTKKFFSTLVKLENLTLSLDGGMPCDLFVETPNLAHLSIIYPIEMMIDDMNEQRGNLVIFAPSVRTFTSVGLCPFMFEGIVYLDYVDIKLEDSDEMRTIIPLKEFDYCRRVITEMFYGVSSAKVLSLDYNILKVFSELPNITDSSPPFFRYLKYLKVPESYQRLSNLRYIFGLCGGADIITEFPQKGVEEVETLKKEIADLKVKTMQILEKASRFGLEKLKQLEQVLDEGLVLVKEKKEQVLVAQLDGSKKKEQLLKKKLEESNEKIQKVTVEIVTLREKEQKVTMENATLQRKIKELQGHLEDEVPREYSPKSNVASSHETKCLTEAAPNSSQETARQTKAGLFLGPPPDRSQRKRKTPEEAETPSGTSDSQID